VKAQQVLGGHGYIAEWGVEQFVRDARIAQIYEGANGIQALDLVGRKLGRDGGRAVSSFFNEVSGFVSGHAGNERMTPYVAPLKLSLGHLQQATLWFVQNGLARPDNAGAGAYDYMHCFGLVALGYMWALQAKVAQEKLSEGANGSTDSMNGKLMTARFFMERMLPETGLRLARITAGADALMEMPAELF
jgi:acyl-CoA dehydrogenase